MTTKYTKDHEWVREQDGAHTVGITDYAQEQLGEIVYVELPAVGATLAQGDDAAVVESVKAASDVKSPLSGTVTERNDNLDGAPELVNDAPEGDGWFYKLSADDTMQLDDLMDADAYKKFVDELD
ncbi:glycine cleavage system protein GcvH [Candidatus Spongiihabitans sp.]|uniref:glycine cleavage system protein GcvH n=1 Tax=Candidatus Spongiihabitans sp. TaxID=3101308 RepID=UPI003C7D5009